MCKVEQPQGKQCFEPFSVNFSTIDNFEEDWRDDLPSRRFVYSMPSRSSDIYTWIKPLFSMCFPCSSGTHPPNWFIHSRDWFMAPDNFIHAKSCIAAVESINHLTPTKTNMCWLLTIADHFRMSGHCLDQEFANFRNKIVEIKDHFVHLSSTRKWQFQVLKTTEKQTNKFNFCNGMFCIRFLAIIKWFYVSIWFMLTKVRQYVFELLFEEGPPGFQ